ncbi:hypothetical protein [Hymenobacter actinosclerus]|uniref:Uncharacterized protein n=1 Tax=Hymenobacter actinosclerus TaxID=82805 RepID=A0A1I0GIZ6_9BACT|nr:hypothetical protein [Hymenobacter actinosclerus]SET70892.1 hypothetical protein SAMN04487998_2436 [Hymenobacter actinosclerus]
MSGFPTAPDSFQQKTTAELQYLIENPGFYDAGVVARARQELRQRGALVPAAPAFPEIATPPAPTEYDAAPAGRGSRWLLAGLALAVGLALVWWIMRPQAVKPAMAPPRPIVLEATVVRPLPSFESEAAVQVARTRSLLPAADRADTTAAGRYARMARRYWLAENTAAHLTAQASTDSVTDVFPGQAGIGLERIDWFMAAKGYNQHLTPTMEARLTLMQQGLTLRRIALSNFKTRYEMYGELFTDRDQKRADAEASDIAGQLLGHSSKQVMQGNISDL